MENGHMADTAQKPQDNQGNEPLPFDERTRRVLELRRQIREGTYRPDPETIALAIMREWGLSGDLLDAVAPGPAGSPDGGFKAVAGRFVVSPTAPGEAEPPASARTA